jgi:hypothetical protein
MKISNLFLKFLDKKKYKKNKLIINQLKEKQFFDSNLKDLLGDIQKRLENKKEINFLHSGHCGDIINSLPVIKKIANSHICNLYLRLNKTIPVDHLDHPFGQVYLNDRGFKMLDPLLKKQKYLSNVEIFKGQEIDVNLDLIRELPIALEFDSMRYSFHIAGEQTDLSEEFIQVEEHEKVKNKIVIQRSLRRQNHLINYKFLNKYEDVYFVGVKNEYEELKKEINHLIFYDCESFLEMASIIKSSKIFIGNASLGFTLAEGLKIPRLLESSPWSSPQQVHGKNGYDFFFQSHFEKFFNILYKK